MRTEVIAANEQPTPRADEIVAYDIPMGFGTGVFAACYHAVTPSPTSPTRTWATRSRS